MYETELFVLLLWFISLLLIFSKPILYNLIGVIFCSLFSIFLYNNYTIFNIPEFLLLGVALSGLGVASIVHKSI